MMRKTYGTAAILATIFVSVAFSPAKAIVVCTEKLGCQSAGPEGKTKPTKQRRGRSIAGGHNAGRHGAGIVRSSKTGATARVSPRYQPAIQAYVNDAEAAGASILFMGGTRPGRCSIPRSKHPCGMAIDLCQYARGIVDRRCNLPPKAQLARIAARHGLIEGGVWCHGDYGHAEVRTGRQAAECSRNLYAAVAGFKARREAQAQ